MSTNAIAMLSGVAMLTAGPLPLQSGDYSVGGKRCSDAAFAELAHYDGKGLSGPHASSCTSRVLSRHGRTIRVATTCTAQGDGSPAPASTITEDIRVIGPAEFIRLGTSRALDLRYRRCQG